MNSATVSHLLRQNYLIQFNFFTRSRAMKRIFIILALFTALCISVEAQERKRKKRGKAKNTATKTILKDVRIPNDGLTVMYGNAMIEKLQEEGSFESYMQTASSGKKIQFRSLAYVGDQVGFRIRASKFGLHLDYLLKQWQANRVIMAFGSNESYAGPEGLATFETQLESYLHLIKDRHANSEYLLCSPIAAEKVSSIDGVNISKRNTDLKLYSDAMAKMAAKHNITFIDLYTPTSKLFKTTDKLYTLDGLHLNDKGSHAVGKLLAKAILGERKLNPISPTTTGFKATRQLIQRKAIEVAQAYPNEV